MAKGEAGAMRSKLFVPGSRPELFAKALASDADAISIDLEDAVDETHKAEARRATAEFLSGRASDGKVLIVRINALATPHFEADLDALVSTNVDILNLAKVEGPDDVRAAAAKIARLEESRSAARPVRLLVTIETPRGIRQAAEIARADPRVVGLQLGFADLLEPLGIDRGHPAAIQQIQLAMRLAAGEAGVWAYDAAFANIRDAEGFRREAEAARRLGFLGKSCIHPSQVAIANAVFQPTESEIAQALRVLDASRRAAADGVGAYVVDGSMVDAPFVRRARDVVASAARLGLMPAKSEP